ncbi:MAG: sigma-E factor negative regulatory protein [Gammaproteobacteria bacterium]|uniref:Anti sigma-E protein RseA N-terminal domain-containing protein n=1 Tax=SAR86 cluster bacterium TaxID=2030880 RepID=A0A520MER4_9GAMM|nr:MAG: hypothetical protein CBE02_02960 [Gammaproteobacteria bacterium TMED242]RZO19716.1 MAG: hypothetical protein EVA96_03560 [SAR86 cluster bacterium]|tara:strand:+ start:725 stop:1411 length:687 start_codon:yes stop_codon:yes gene_type:complete
MDNNKNLEENLSALFDGELDPFEIQNVLESVSKRKDLQKKLSYYGLISSALNQENPNEIFVDHNRNKLNYNFWFSNGLTAAASILITLFFINQTELSRMGEDYSAKNKLDLAINSEEAKNIVNMTENNLVDHVMSVINNPDFMNTKPYNVDLKNVGFTRQPNNQRMFMRGNENFTLRIEKKDLGLKKVRNWKHGNKTIYLVPLADGRVLTIYGNIDTQSALAVANIIN